MRNAITFGGAWLARKGDLDQQTANSATDPIVDYVLGATPLASA